jgi:hypothetical protein
MSARPKTWIEIQNPLIEALVHFLEHSNTPWPKWLPRGGLPPSPEDLPRYLQIEMEQAFQLTRYKDLFMVVAAPIEVKFRPNIEERLYRVGEQTFWVIDNLQSGWFFFSELLILQQWYFKSHHDAAMFRLVWG